MLQKDVKNVVTNVKRLMGARFDDPNMPSNLTLIPAQVKENEAGMPEIIVENYLGQEKTSISPEEVSAAILTELKQMAWNFLGDFPT